ncbi:MAG: hypothetical protein SPK75_06155 [Victivallales bacterium]|nr:hypothetical protein [bacterium]MDD7752251.1 hypothetical protein [bacterium]MDY5695939.1 hypothetical protein [Victivallales bacterium]
MSQIFSEACKNSVVPQCRSHEKRGKGAKKLSGSGDCRRMQEEAWMR